MSRQAKSYAQGLAAAKSGKGKFGAGSCMKLWNLSGLKEAWRLIVRVWYALIRGKRCIQAAR